MGELKRILVVDDEETIRKGLRGMLELLGYQVETARDGLEALDKVNLDFDLVLLDVVMPVMDGFHVVKKIRENANPQELPIIMVTGMSSREDRIKAVEIGANDFISKPFDITEIRARTSSLLHMKAAHDALKKHKIELEATIRQRTTALQKVLEDVSEAKRMLQTANLETIQRLVVAAEFKDRGTAKHIVRMSRFSAMLARKMDLPSSEVELILQASPMHDIGKIGTPEEILLKPGKLDDEEWELMRQHPIMGMQILKDSSSKLLRAGETIALSHHEKWDGSGYPLGLAKEDIPLWGRICAVADVFDALISDRPYKRAFSIKEAVRVLWESRGKHLDPELVDVFTDNIDEIRAILKSVNEIDYSNHTAMNSLLTA